MITCDWCKKVSGALNVIPVRVSLIPEYRREMDKAADLDDDHTKRPKAVVDLCLDCIPKAREVVRAMILKAGCHQPEKML